MLEMAAGKCGTLWSHLLHYLPHFTHQVLISLNKLGVLSHQLLPPLLGEVPHPLDGVQCTTVWRKEQLPDPIVEVFLHNFRIVNAQVIHIHIRLSFDLADQL